MFLLEMLKNVALNHWATMEVTSIQRNKGGENLIAMLREKRRLEQNLENIGRIHIIYGTVVSLLIPIDSLLVFCP